MHNLYEYVFDQLDGKVHKGCCCCVPLAVYCPFYLFIKSLQILKSAARARSLVPLVCCPDLQDFLLPR